jgi:hypothetical protein
MQPTIASRSGSTASATMAAYGRFTEGTRSGRSDRAVMSKLVSFGAGELLTSMAAVRVGSPEDDDCDDRFERASPPDVDSLVASLRAGSSRVEAHAASQTNASASRTIIERVVLDARASDPTVVVYQRSRIGMTGTSRCEPFA